MIIMALKVLPIRKMKRTLSLFWLLLISCSAKSEDLSGKAITFSAETTADYVKLAPLSSDTIFVRQQAAASVCLRYFTDLPAASRWQCYFSLATPKVSNAFLLCKQGSKQEFFIGGYSVAFWGLPDEPNKWHSFCMTWDSKTGLTQVWVNGKPSARKAVFKGGSFKGMPIIVLGQDQDSYGGGFKSKEAMVGQLADVHMWDYVITNCDIANFAKKNLFTGGNVVNWHALEYTMHGNMVLEDKIQCCSSDI